MDRKDIKTDLLIHDLKNPITVIHTGIMGLLSKKDKYGPLTPKQEKVLKRVLRNTIAAKMLVNDALELSRSKEGIINRAKAPLSHIIRQAFIDLFDLMDSEISEKLKISNDLDNIKEIAGRAGLGLFIDRDLWGKICNLDEAKTMQILRNLLSNAFKYKNNLVALSVRIDKNSLVFSVKDDGEGIPKKYQEKIFNCYFQMEPDDICVVRGHGIGLAGVLALVQDLGGTLSLISDTGKGAEFIVSLPLTN